LPIAEAIGATSPSTSRHTATTSSSGISMPAVPSSASAPARPSEADEARPLCWGIVVRTATSDPRAALFDPEGNAPHVVIPTGPGPLVGVVEIELDRLAAG
jgi:hypothetical protein